eukprot:COSAG01_NODE_28913_length_649_cov_6.118182_1_plen_142_part_10
MRLLSWLTLRRHLCAVILPPAWHSAKINAAVGGTDPALFQYVPSARYDSWLTVGLTDGDPQQKLSSVGQNWDLWRVDRGVWNSNCAVFWMDPRASTATRSRGAVTVAQLTLPTAFSGNVTVGFAGKTASGGTWREDNVVFML